MKYATIIGLEIHAQLNTKSKMFSKSATNYGAQANSQADEVDLAMPGTLPVVNEKAIEFAVKFGLAINATINKKNIFSRKNYFYPDLPKGYQISQMDLPIIGAGSVEVNLGDTIKTIGITRAHLEEDAGKSIHNMIAGFSGIDLNRAGTPLLEIVSEPDMHSSKEAVCYAKKIYQIVSYLKINDGNMQEGSFRMDANVSLKLPNANKLGTRTELKNINSFKFLQKAIDLEIIRQTNILNEGGNITQETRLYDADKNETRTMRTKEDANDYRYFPDPDLLPVIISDKLIATIKTAIGELPDDKKARYVKEFKLSEYDANLLTNDKATADFFEEMVKIADAKLSANWIIGDLSSYLKNNDLTIDKSKVSAINLANLINNITNNVISSKIAKQTFAMMWQTGKTADTIISEKKLTQITDNKAIEKIVINILMKYPKQIQDFKNGNQKLLGFFVGQVMKETNGKGDPKIINQVLRQKLNS